MLTEFIAAFESEGTLPFSNCFDRKAHTADLLKILCASYTFNFV